MNEKITSYESLMEEQKRLKGLLEVQKGQIQKDVQELKQELRPVINVMSFIGKLAIPDVNHNSAVKAGAGLTIEWILKKALSSNPLLRLIVPTLAKNYSSHYIGKVAPLLQKLKDKILPGKGA
jgi:hypothetical protein